MVWGQDEDSNGDAIGTVERSAVMITPSATEADHNSDDPEETAVASSVTNHHPP